MKVRDELQAFMRGARAGYLVAEGEIFPIAGPDFARQRLPPRSCITLDGQAAQRIALLQKQWLAAEAARS